MISSRNSPDLRLLNIANHLGISTAFPRFLVLMMYIGRTHLQSVQMFHMHLHNDHNMGYLLPSTSTWYTGFVGLCFAPRHSIKNLRHSVKLSFSNRQLRRKPKPSPPARLCSSTGSDFQLSELLRHVTVPTICICLMMVVRQVTTLNINTNHRP